MNLFEFVYILGMCVFMLMHIYSVHKDNKQYIVNDIVGTICYGMIWPIIVIVALCFIAPGWIEWVCEKCEGLLNKKLF